MYSSLKAGVILVILLALTSFVPVLANSCSEALLIQGDYFTAQIDTTQLEIQPGEPQPCGFIGKTVWYRFTPEASGVVNLNTQGSDFDTVLALWRGSCENLQPVACQARGALSQVPVEANTSYLIQAGGFQGAAGNLHLNVNSRGNVRLGFPQIAVGDAATTFVDLTNQGTETFSGLLVILDDNGDWLPVTLNEAEVFEDYPLNLPPGSTQRLTLTREGETADGHILIYDRHTLKGIELGAQIDGTLIYRIRHAGSLVDTIGVPASAVFFGPGVKSHFYFFAERTPTLRTGVALSHPGAPSFQPIEVRLVAISETGQQVGETNVLLDPLHHTAFFVDEVIALPPDFRGVVVVTAPGALFPIVLRSEGMGLADLRLSSVQVSPVSAMYDFDLNLFDGRSFSGEMTFNVADVRVQGLARFTSRQPDQDFEITPLTGASIQGLFIATMYTSFDEQPVAVVLYDIAFGTQVRNINAGALWMGLGGTVFGTLVATRRDNP